MSLIKAAANFVVGYVLAIVTQILVFPWLSIETGLIHHLAMGLVFLVVSLAQSCVLHRVFERIGLRDNSHCELSMTSLSL